MPDEPTPPPAMPADLRAAAVAARGFMPADEGDALWDAGIDAGRSVPDQPFLEIGSYCGKSSVWLGAAARAAGTVLYALDHHRGSEENQPGWEWHEPDLVDPAVGRIDTLPMFRRTIDGAGLEDAVVALVGDSPLVGRHWTTPLALLFIDGGHGVEPAHRDYELWTPHVAPGRVARHPRRVPRSRRRRTAAVRDLPAGAGVRPVLRLAGHRLAEGAAAPTLTRRRPTRRQSRSNARSSSTLSSRGSTAS